MERDDDLYRRARARVRRRPTWWLRRRERRIVARVRPDGSDLAELAAIRRELHRRSGGSGRFG